MKRRGRRKVWIVCLAIWMWLWGLLHVCLAVYAGFTLGFGVIWLGVLGVLAVAIAIMAVAEG